MTYYSFQISLFTQLLESIHKPELKHPVILFHITFNPHITWLRAYFIKYKEVIEVSWTLKGILNQFFPELLSSVPIHNSFLSQSTAKDSGFKSLKYVTPFLTTFPKSNSWID